MIIRRNPYHLKKKNKKNESNPLNRLIIIFQQSFDNSICLFYRKFCGLPWVDTFDELHGSMPNETIRRYSSIFE